MNKKIIIPIVILAIFATAFAFYQFKPDDGESELIVPVKRSEFVIDITTTGELEAKNSVPIRGPKTVRNFRIYQLTIQDIVDEGTEVKKGDWVATLDKSELQSKLQEAQIELEQAQSQYIQTQLDTALDMRKSRDELINLKFAVKEKQIQLDQSQYEPPAIIEKAKIDLQKAKRELQQAKENYKIKLDQNKAKMREKSAQLRKKKMDFTNMQKILGEFVVKAPEEGMVIYTKGWDGKQIKAGSQISTWNPVVASLPDLRVMLSKTYINEVDVRKVKAGQKVEIGLDAFPDKKLHGTITSIANVGEQLPNTDAKVFLATVEIEGRDKSLRPAMTTSNRIIIDEIDSVKHIPLECLHTQNDSITYVYKKSGLGITKQEIALGKRNNNGVIVKSGLETSDKVYLSVPDGVDDKEVNLLPELNGKRSKDKPDNNSEGKISLYKEHYDIHSSDITKTNS